MSLIKRVIDRRLQIQRSGVYYYHIVFFVFDSNKFLAE
jgi:hypothetical protein